MPNSPATIPSLPPEQQDALVIEQPQQADADKERVSDPGHINQDNQGDESHTTPPPEPPPAA